MTTATINDRGGITIPSDIRNAFDLVPGSQLAIEVREGEIVLRLVEIAPVEKYTMERKAEFLLNNATTLADYEEAIELVRRMGFDPDKIAHERPTK